MNKIISFVHISLDGFVAGPNGEMDWININPEIFDHVEKRISQTNTAIYGRVTFGMMEAYWPTAADKPDPSSHDINHSKWYKEARKIVLSSTLNEDGRSDLKVLNENIKEQLEAITSATASDGKDILVFGSPSTTHYLMEQGLIDGYWLFVNPIVLGEGIPLFKNKQERTKLKLVTPPKPFECGVTELNYLKG